jgi:hypothetical protein
MIHNRLDAAATGALAVPGQVPITTVPTTSAPAAPSTSPGPVSAAATTSASTSTTATTTAPADGVTSADPSAALTFIGVVLVAVAAAAITPIILDALRTARWRDNLTSWIIQQRLSGDDLKTALAAVAHPRGTQGLTRSLIALLVIVLAAAALSVTLFSTAADASDLRKTIVTSLLTVLAGVSGFYFGARTAETTSDTSSAARPGPAGPRPGAPVITTVTPDTGSNPATVTLTGTGLSGASVGGNVPLYLGSLSVRS